MNRTDNVLAECVVARQRAGFLVANHDGAVVAGLCLVRLKDKRKEKKAP